MKYKKGLIFICLIICLFTIASVCASNANDTVVASDDNQIKLSQDSINDAMEDDSLKSNEVDEIITSNPKTFSSLNTTINGNGDSDVYLDGNYTFELGSDSDFKEGITISRAVTVHGNGFTIDGDNTARIFTVTNSNVVFKDIVFVNGKTAGDGGAVNGVCNVINCTFENNSAYYGGAMNGGFAFNSTFNGNVANSGGALS